ncbi:MAG: chemotaxis protein CheA [Planctomycetales bacterium]|nr:chemotaxis protein CheA [Planctomycetales bacterium]
MQIDISRFRDSFFVEAAEHLENMEAALLQLEGEPENTETLNTIFRAAHSIKGASTTFGMDEVGKFTHVLENLLDQLREGVAKASDQLVELMLTSVDVIEGLLAAEKENADPPENVDEVISALNEAFQAATGGQSLDGPSGTICKAVNDPAKPSNVTVYEIQLLPSREFFCFGQDPYLLLRELAEMGHLLDIQADSSALPPLAEMNPEHCYLHWTIKLQTEATEAAIHDVFMFVDEATQWKVSQATASDTPKTSEIDSATETPADADSESHTYQTTPVAESTDDSTRAKPTTSPKSSMRRTISAGENETVRVDRRRLDELINQIGELVIGTSMVEQDLASFGAGRESAAMGQLGKIVRDLQEMSLSLRMVPIAATFQKMARVVRDVSKKLGKEVQFITFGDETELDKTVVDQIGDPLVHMVRNAVDHGVEMPEDRERAGKPTAGRVELRAFQQGGNIYIELQDDGKGLNRKTLLSKAIEKGVIDSAENLSDNEICNLIFAPGFSTAAEVTDVSGRGVGMDVVRRNVEALQGSVSIRSEEGKGSTISVRLPLTLAILDGLLVRLEHEVYIIPLLSVVESIRVSPDQIKRIVGVGEVITLRGEVIPLLRLHQALQRSNGHDNEDGLLVIVEDQGRRMALMVDELLGQQQVVIKNLETNFRKVPGIAGATILGDGRVALIVDIYGVSLMHRQPTNGTPASRESTSLDAINSSTQHAVVESNTDPNSMTAS